MDSDETGGYKGIAMYGELIPVGGGDPIPLLKKSLLIGRRESCESCCGSPMSRPIIASLPSTGGIGKFAT